RRCTRALAERAALPLASALTCALRDALLNLLVLAHERRAHTLLLGGLRLRGRRLLELAALVAHLDVAVDTRRRVAERPLRRLRCTETLRGDRGSTLAARDLDLEVEQEPDRLLANLPHH